MALDRIQCGSAGGAWWRGTGPSRGVPGKGSGGHVETSREARPRTGAKLAREAQEGGGLGLRDAFEVDLVEAHRGCALLWVSVVCHAIGECVLPHTF